MFCFYTSNNFDKMLAKILAKQLHFCLCIQSWDHRYRFIPKVTTSIVQSVPFSPRLNSITSDDYRLSVHQDLQVSVFCDQMTDTRVIMTVGISSSTMRLCVPSHFSHHIKEPIFHSVSTLLSLSLPFLQLTPC
jgi:hypothetical protein